MRHHAKAALVRLGLLLPVLGLAIALIISSLGDSVPAQTPAVAKVAKVAPFGPITAPTSATTKPAQPTTPALVTKGVRVPAGSNLTRVGRENHTPLAEVLEFNPEYKKHPNFVRAGARIIVRAYAAPATPAAPADPKAPAATPAKPAPHTTPALAAPAKKAAPAVSAKPASAVSSSGWFSPLGHAVTCSSHFGEYRPSEGRGHIGTDMPAPVGTPIHAVTSGTVVKAGGASGYGKVIVIKHDDGTYAEYGHVNTIAKYIRAGVRVTGNELIGTVGAEGKGVTGPHLHLTFTKGGLFDRTELFSPEKAMAARGIRLCA